MTREWFTMAEVRAAGVATLGAELLDFMVADFHALRADGKARLARRFSNKRTAGIEMEFHISLFMQAEQAQLRRVLGTGHFGRILKLGLHRPVTDKRSYYEPARGSEAA